MESFIAGSIQTGSQIKQGAFGRPKACNAAQNEYVPHGCCGTYCSRKLLVRHALTCTPLFGCVRRRGLVFHVDDLDAAVHFRNGWPGSFELALVMSNW